MPATWQILSPTLGLPVKEIFRTRGSPQSCSPTEPPGPVTHWIPSEGRPASRSNSVKRRAESGVSVGGLAITALPAAKAGPTLWQRRFRGKLNGLMATTTPHGTLRVKPNFPCPPEAASRGMVSPRILFASSADSSMVSAARTTSNLDSHRALPDSLVIRRAKSSWFSLSRPAVLVRML